MAAKKYTTAQQRRANWYGSNWIRREKRLAIYLRDSFTCAYCGAKLHNAKPRQVTLDHIDPVCSAGNNEATNLVTCCKPCNDRKSGRPIHEFLKGNAGAIALVYLRAGLSLNLDLAKALLRGDS